LPKPDPGSFIASSSGRALFTASVAQNLLAARGLTISVSGGAGRATGSRAAPDADHPQVKAAAGY
jgi:hypothetical protein